MIAIGLIMFFAPFAAVLAGCVVCAFIDAAERREWHTLALYFWWLASLAVLAVGVAR